MTLELQPLCQGGKKGNLAVFRGIRGFANYCHASDTPRDVAFFQQTVSAGSVLSYLAARRGCGTISLQNSQNPYGISSLETLGYVVPAGS
jgi:hypothetical protein